VLLSKQRSFPNDTKITSINNYVTFTTKDKKESHDMKIAVLLNEDTSYKCTGAGCLNALFTKSDAFENYSPDTELVGFFHNGGELEQKIERLKSKGVHTIHLSTCLRAKFSGYEELAKRLSHDFDVVGYTHGSKEGKTKAAVMYKKGEFQTT